MFQIIEIFISFLAVVVCPNLQDPPNGVVSLSDGTGFESQATYTCNDGFVTSSGDDHVAKHHVHMHGTYGIYTFVPCSKTPCTYGIYSVYIHFYHDTWADRRYHHNIYYPPYMLAQPIHPVQGVWLPE